MAKLWRDAKDVGLPGAPIGLLASMGPSQDEKRVMGSNPPGREEETGALGSAFKAQFLELNWAQEK